MRRLAMRLPLPLLLLVSTACQRATEPPYEPVESDMVPPRLMALSFTPMSVSTTEDVARVSVAFTVTDDRAGVVRVTATFFSPSFVALVWPPLEKRIAPSTSYSGEYSFDFSKATEPGAWSFSISVYDQVGNLLFLDADGLRALHLPTSVEVVSVAQEDRSRTPPWAIQ